MQIRTPKGTRGTVGLPFPGNSTQATLVRGNTQKEWVRADASGRFWLEDVAGGEHEYLLVASLGREGADTV